MQPVRRFAGGPGPGACLLVLMALSARPVYAEAPVVSVWYRGTPAGVPRQDDLALIRSLGFTAISWPAAQTAALPALRRSAKAVGLHVMAEFDEPLPQGASIARSGNRLRIRVDRTSSARLPALLWTAVVDGARAISLDAGQIAGHGIADPSGQERAWVRPAVAFAGLVAANLALFETMTTGPAVIVETPSPEVTVALFAAPRTWVLIAANNTEGPRTLAGRVPPGVPYAIWTSLLDGSTMSMLSDPAGARLRLPLAAGEAAVYFADR